MGFVFDPQRFKAISIVHTPHGRRNTSIILQYIGTCSGVYSHEKTGADHLHRLLHAAVRKLGARDVVNDLPQQLQAAEHVD